MASLVICLINFIIMVYSMGLVSIMMTLLVHLFHPLMYPSRAPPLSSRRLLLSSSLSRHQSSSTLWNGTLMLSNISAFPIKPGKDRFLICKIQTWPLCPMSLCPWELIPLVWNVNNKRNNNKKAKQHQQQQRKHQQPKYLSQLLPPSAFLQPWQPFLPLLKQNFNKNELSRSLLLAKRNNLKLYKRPHSRRIEVCLNREASEIFGDGWVREKHIHHLPCCNELSANKAVSAPEAGTIAWRF